MVRLVERLIVLPEAAALREVAIGKITEDAAAIARDHDLTDGRLDLALDTGGVGFSSRSKRRLVAKRRFRAGVILFIPPEATGPCCLQAALRLSDLSIGRNGED